MKQSTSVGAYGAIALLLCCAVSCAPPATGVRAPVSRSEFERTLEALRTKSEAVETFQITGTILLEWETQRHFVHYESWYGRPGNFRIDCTLSGPHGLGSGTLRYLEREGTAELVLPDEPPVTGPIGGDAIRAVETGGLSLRDARYGLFPYAGGALLFLPERLKARGVDPSSGRYRLTLRREDGLEEVLLVDPDPVSLAERRVVQTDGTVLAVVRYAYQAPGDPFPRETESRFPRDESRARIRYRSVRSNETLPEGVFAWWNETQ